MSLITYPLDNVEYTADDAALFHATRTTGIHTGNDFAFSVRGSDNTVMLGPGIAWMNIGRFKGVVTALKVETPVDAGLPDPVYPRIDHVILKYDANKNAIDPVIKSGTAGSNPQPPTRSMTEALYEIHLIRIRREPGAVSISAADITDLRLDPNWCGLMAESVTNVDTESINRNVQQILTEVKQETSAVLTSINKELEDLQAGAGVELRKLQFTDTVVPVSAFVFGSPSRNFPYWAAVNLPNVIDSMIPEVYFTDDDAESGNYSSVPETYNGGIYIKAASPPETDLSIPTIICWRGNA